MGRRVRFIRQIQGGDWPGETDDREIWYLYRQPDVYEKGFYREVGSLNCFFHGGRTRKNKDHRTHTYNNWTNKRFFTLKDEWEHQNAIDIAAMFKEKHGVNLAVPPPIDQMRVFENLYEFYDFIGYDYKAKRYLDPEEKKITLKFPYHA